MSPAKRSPINGNLDFRIPSIVGLSTRDLISSMSCGVTHGFGQKQPIPPVINPLSSSYTCLASVAGGKERTVYPSENESTNYNYQ